MAVIGPNGELSVIVTWLGCESVICLDNHMQWLHRLFIITLLRVVSVYFFVTLQVLF